MTGLFSKLNKRLPSRAVSSDAIPIARVIHNVPIPSDCSPEQLEQLVTAHTTVPSPQIAPATNPWEPLSILIADPSVTDIFIAQPDMITVRRGAQHSVTPETLTESQYRALIDDAENQIKARCTTENDFVEGMVNIPVFGRLTLAHPVLNASDWVLMHLRIPRISTTFYDLIKARMLPAALASWLTEAVAARCIHIAICGGPHSGKTTLTSTLLHSTPTSERIITIENIPEIHPPSRRIERFGRGAARENRQQIIEHAIRNAPDRLIMTDIVASSENQREDVLRLLKSSVPVILEFASMDGDSVCRYINTLESPLPILLIETQLHSGKPVVRQIVEISGMDMKMVDIVLFHDAQDEKRRWIKVGDETSLVIELLHSRGHELKVGASLLDRLPENE